MIYKHHTITVRQSERDAKGNQWIVRVNGKIVGEKMRTKAAAEQIGKIFVEERLQGRNP